jgi:hypothetical protein
LSAERSTAYAFQLPSSYEPKLGIGIKTVEKHREHLMQKLDIHDTAGLTRYAISESDVQLTMV